MRNYFIGVLISSFFIASIFVLISNKDFKNLYLNIWVIVFLLSLLLVATFLPLIEFINGKLEFYWVFCCAFLVGGVVALLSIYSVFGFLPSWNILTAYYFIFGGGAGVISFCVNLLTNKMFPT